MALLLIATITLAYILIGADGAFKAGSWGVSTGWIILSIVVGFAAAFVGGKVCRLISQSGAGPISLVVIIVIIGLAMAIHTGEPINADSRTVSPGWRDAMQGAAQPVWVMYLNPLLGGLGVAYGGGLIGRKDDVMQ